VFFRVNRVMKNSVININSGDKVLASFKRDHLAPGEMEHIVLPKAVITAAESEITVAIEEVQ